MLVAVKDYSQIHIQDEDAEGFRAAGYEIYREELVPVEAHTVSISNIPLKASDQPMTIEGSSEPVLPTFHPIRSANESD